MDLTNCKVKGSMDVFTSKMIPMVFGGMELTDGILDIIFPEKSQNILLDIFVKLVSKNRYSPFDSMTTLCLKNHSK